MSKSLKYFGTDGIRGHVGVYPITADFMLKLGWAIGMVLKEQGGKKVLIGKDPRISGYMIESALQAGLASAGMKVFLVGPMPTAAIAYLSRTFRVDLGIVISASHNPYDDNGIKLFSATGFKLPFEFEKKVEDMVEAKEITTAPATELGKALRIENAAGRFIEYCKSAIPHHTRFDNYKLVVDCANGATFHIAPAVFTELGAVVHEINAQPTGFNINLNCGSNHPGMLQKHVLELKADIGIAFDGDGDRVVLVDHKGEILDGNEILYIIVKGLMNAGQYNGGVVGTHMSNGGLALALRDLGVPFERVNVGSHHVIEALMNNKWLLGGEPSGHITYLRINTTDDGIVAALLVLKTMHQTGLSLHELKQGMLKFPQNVISIPHHNHRFDLDAPDMKKIMQHAENQLGDCGRVLMRYSGTEDVIRVMVEGQDSKQVDLVMHLLCDEIKKRVQV